MAPAPAAPPHIAPFSPYPKLVVGVLAFLQFTVVLDFMILSPLGPILMPQLGIAARQFGLVVSAYAFSAGVSGLLTAGFADKFDRRTLREQGMAQPRFHPSITRCNLNRSWVEACPPQ